MTNYSVGREKTNSAVQQKLLCVLKSLSMLRSDKVQFKDDLRFLLKLICNCIRTLQIKQ